MGINENADLDPSQVEDLRGSSGGGGDGGGGLPPGGGMQFPGMGGGGGGMGGGGLGGLAGLIPLLMRSKIGCGVLVILALCVGGFMCFGGGLGSVGNLGGLSAPGGGNVTNPQANSSAIAQSCSTANPDRFKLTECRNLLYINSIQNYWQSSLPQAFGKPYQPATTRLFSGRVSTACGSADSGVGPFYCPGDNHVYIDLSFYRDLADRFGAPGQFAQAYVLAHEYGHHVQTLLGTEAQVRRAQQRDPENANHYSVAMELQADCYAGVWANAATKTTTATGKPLFTEVTPQDVSEALQAASAVGDDAIQRGAGGSVNPDAFTHGSSAQRQQWFNQGYTTGDPRQCDTFAS